MQFYGKAEQSAKRILSLFESGDVPKALSPIFIRRDGDEPCRKWSWSNQLLTALAGYDDARGFKQWQAVGRHVRKGEHGFPILCPCTSKRDVTDKEGLPIPTDPKWAEKMVKYHGLNIRDHLNQLPARLLSGVAQAA